MTAEQNANRVESGQEGENDREQDPLDRVVTCPLRKDAFIFLPTIVVVTHDARNSRASSLC